MCKNTFVVHANFSQIFLRSKIIEIGHANLIEYFFTYINILSSMKQNKITNFSLKEIRNSVKFSQYRSQNSERDSIPSQQLLYFWACTIGDIWIFNRF